MSSMQAPSQPSERNHEDHENLEALEARGGPHRPALRFETGARDARESYRPKFSLRPIIARRGSMNITG